MNINNIIAFPSSIGMEFFRINKIVRCEANGRYTQFFFEDKSTYLVTKSLKEVEEILKDCSFFRVHHSHLVHLNFISRYNKNGFLEMLDGSKVDVSRRKREEFIKLFSK